uniref:Uncharacterized protein n=1 Tax=Cannabis sativa TaxID=3483 RepID=A0A803NYB5_CANSA
MARPMHSDGSMKLIFGWRLKTSNPNVGPMQLDGRSDAVRWSLMQPRWSVRWSLCIFWLEVEDIGPNVGRCNPMLSDGPMYFLLWYIVE